MTVTGRLGVEDGPGRRTFSFCLWVNGVDAEGVLLLRGRSRRRPRIGPLGVPDPCQSPRIAPSGAPDAFPGPVPFPWV